MCGEQGTDHDVDLTEWGSPPRVRGTDFACQGGLRAVGITPACAGNSAFRHYRLWGAQDHPRVCGEQMVTPGVMVTA